MNTHTARSITCRTLLVPVMSALLILSFVIEIATLPINATPLYAGNVDILIIESDTYYIDETDPTHDDYQHYNDYDQGYSPYELYGEDQTQYWESPAGNVFDIIEQNLMLDNPNDQDDGIYFQDGFQTI